MFVVHSATEIKVRNTKFRAVPLLNIIMRNLEIQFKTSCFALPKFPIFEQISNTKCRP